jgi:peptidoglycan/xylan/chitin deacetylase (PgdA/CDA1 family)
MSATAYAWPNGNRVAVIVSVLVETWSEGHAPTYFPRTTPLRQGTTDLAGINWSQFGTREGIWRITRVLDECGIKATYMCNGRAAELYPEAIAQVVRSGHELGGHGYLQDELLAYMTPDQEQATIRRSLAALEKASGQRPSGWVTNIYGWSQHTLNFLAQEKIRWCCDALDASLPYRRQTPQGSVVMIPWSDFVDNRVLRASPLDLFSVYKETFDYLHAHEPMGLLHIGFHCHFGGRPMMAAMLHKVLRYLQGFPNVWFARHSEIAQWYDDQNIDDPSYARRFFA